MATNPADLFTVIAPIAAAYAGVGGVASGLWQRRGGGEDRVDAFRVATMLYGSLSATLLGFLPATLGALSVTEEWAVRISSLAALVVMVFYVPTGFARALTTRDVPGWSRRGTIAASLFLLTSFAAFALATAGVQAQHSAGLYLLGLVGLLGSSVVMFWRVITAMLLPSHGP